MTLLRETIGKPVILRETAEQVGDVRFFAVNGVDRRVTALVSASGRSSRVIEWADIENVGPDAVIVATIREPTSEDDRTVSGARNPLDKRLLTSRGNELGEVTDLDVDEAGSIKSLVVGDGRIDGARVRGVGSYAIVIEADPGEA